MHVMEISYNDMEVQTNTIADVRVDASFRKIRKNAICFHMWKIEEDRVEVETGSQCGTFLDDGAYIIYAASPDGTYVNQNTITRESKSGSDLERFIHFWLGEKVSEQKRSNVAHKVQELDSYFGNISTEYRETQFNESARFLSYFKGVLYIRSSALITHGGNRLYRVFGRKWLRCVEMHSIDWEHFSSDCIMVLKTDPHLYVWMGRSSSIAERNDAMELAKDLQENSNEISIVDDGYEQSIPEPRKKLWNTLLPLNKRSVKQTLGEQSERKLALANKLKMYKCDFSGARLHLNQLDVVIPTREDLKDSTMMYLLDAFSQGIWLWVGLKASSQHKISALGDGRAFIKKKKYPFSTIVVRVIEGHEPIEFTRLFPNWRHHLNEARAILKPVPSLFGKYDALTLYERPRMAAEVQLIDDGSGERKIYRINKEDIEELTPSDAVIFFTSCCYVTQYSSRLTATPSSKSQIIGIKDIVYQWNGSEASSDTLSKCESFAKRCFDGMPQKAMFVQMSEFDETPHFLQIFGGKLIILHNKRDVFATNNTSNKKTDSCTDIAECASEDTNYNFILKVYGDASYNAKAVEVYPLSSMSSKECYVLRTNEVWIWCGHSSTGDSREVAKNIASMFGEYTLVMEGKESKEFWSSMKSQMNESLISNCSLCDKKNTSHTNHNNNVRSSFQHGHHGTNVTKRARLAQLFLIFTRHNQIQILEIFGYGQADLRPENIYILDAGIICYIWLGEHASTYEKGKYLKLAQYYLESVCIGRRTTTAIGVIRQADEPNIFKGFFETWNNSLWSNYMPYEQKRQVFALSSTSFINDTSRLKIENEDLSLTALLNRQDEFDQFHKYPIGVLQQETELLPVEVNPLKREVHLTHDDFVALFEMPFQEFAELPLWKRQELKKKHKLF